ncbi:MAG TPA: glucan 1,4-alpha-glucosidase [Steroidobacteraceae bacterium]|nr:glucan 1,4-alpha-glucosidase [Steroidobacteraceae bacterium]HQX78927.1 glucan 1,4-alpha-glucosidase [Steroidobacteraceae bacterium]HQZ80807.1 glucan 1,4-alpha-glucosidase [Steroidobacteraceae bacterium]
MTGTFAPGWPGSEPRWTSSAKTGVGTSLSSASHVWFTLSHGILNEVYYPRLDTPCTRDLGLIVTDGHDYFSEEKRHARSRVSYPVAGVPLYRLTNLCGAGRYRIEKDILADPVRDTVLQRTRFTPLTGVVSDYHLYVLAAPHLGNRGRNNTAWLGDYKGVPMLFAQRDGFALAIACSAPWRKRSAGFVGTSDGWQDLSRHRLMTWEHARAENGNVALAGEVDLDACAGSFELALGFGSTPSEAGHRALASLTDGFEAAQAAYVREWQDWNQVCLRIADDQGADYDAYRTSLMVLRVHESKRLPGGLIASLSFPWGFAKSDDDMGGYHLAWPRDLVESAGALLAAGAHEDVRRVLHYLQTTQESDGHWPQNMWLDGTPYWNGIQMDEAAFPILLTDLARREGALSEDDFRRLWSMTRRAAGFLVRNGPVTQQDRWEEDAGYSPFTLAAVIAALLAAAELADANDECAVAAYLRETADHWNAGIERWIYVTDTELARKVGVKGYYVRIAPPEICEAASPAQGFVPIKNRPPDQSAAPAAQIVSPDALALVRFGLRAPDDPRILDTVRVIDALLKVEMPGGPAWHRYNGDGYGEHADGAPFDGTGCGRAWPLLTGERAHFELAAGRPEIARQLAGTLMALANDGGMLPEQVWDAPDLPKRELFFGRPSGSAMPLVWAHAEYIKLLRSLREKRVFDMPPQTVARYITKKTGSPYATWRFNHKRRSLPCGHVLRIETLAQATVHWSDDGWRTLHDTSTQDTGLGVYLADLPTSQLAPGTVLTFTFFWSDAARWEGVDFGIVVA